VLFVSAGPRLAFPAEAAVQLTDCTSGHLKKRCMEAAIATMAIILVMNRKPQKEHKLLAQPPSMRTRHHEKRQHQQHVH